MVAEYTVLFVMQRHLWDHLRHKPLGRTVKRAWPGWPHDGCAVSQFLVAACLVNEDVQPYDPVSWHVTFDPACVAAA